MPTFDFECAKCKAVFEFSRPFGSKENPPCPECKSKKTQKLFSAPIVVFKGEGWYKTDSRPKAKEAATSDAAKDAPKKDARDAKDPSTALGAGAKTTGSVPAAKEKQAKPSAPAGGKNPA